MVRSVVNDLENDNGTVNGSKATNIAQHKIDALGEFIELDTNFLLDRHSWSDLFHLVKGRSNFSAALPSLQH